MDAITALFARDDGVHGSVKYTHLTRWAHMNVLWVKYLRGLRKR